MDHLDLNETIKLSRWVVVIQYSSLRISIQEDFRDTMYDLGGNANYLQISNI